MMYEPLANTGTTIIDGLTIADFLKRQHDSAAFVRDLLDEVSTACSIDADTIERALAELEASGSVLVRDHYCADPHVDGEDQRIVGLVDADNGEDPQVRCIQAIERVWNGWLAEFLATHRCG